MLDFIDAIKPITKKFHTVQLERVQDLQDEDRIDKIPDLYEILDKFRNRMRLRQLQKGQRSTAFATYQDALADGVEQDEQGKQDDGKKRPWPYLCGEQHPVDNYDYIHKQLRGKDQKEDLKRSEQLRKALKKVKALIKRSRKRVSDKQYKTGSKQAKSTQNASDSQANLASIALAIVISLIRNSQMLDNVTIDHVCNNIKLLYDFHPSIASNRLESGIQSLEIYGYKIAYISIQTLHGLQKLRLNDVAYILRYITNLIYFRRLNRGGI